MLIINYVMQFHLIIPQTPKVKEWEEKKNRLWWLHRISRILIFFRGEITAWNISLKKKKWFRDQIMLRSPNRWQIPISHQRRPLHTHIPSKNSEDRLHLHSVLGELLPILYKVYFLYYLTLNLSTNCGLFTDRNERLPYL